MALRKDGERVSFIQEEELRRRAFAARYRDGLRLRAGIDRMGVWGQVIAFTNSAACWKILYPASR